MAMRLAMLPVTQLAQVRSPVQAGPTKSVKKVALLCNSASWQELLLQGEDSEAL
jgi:hypothetical protein